MLPQFQSFVKKNPLLLPQNSSDEHFPRAFRIGQQILDPMAVQGGPWRAYADTFIPKDCGLFYFETDLLEDDAPLKIGVSAVRTTDLEHSPEMKELEKHWFQTYQCSIPKLKPGNERPNIIKTPKPDEKIAEISLKNDKVFVNDLFFTDAFDQPADSKPGQKKTRGCFLDLKNHRIWFTQGNQVSTDLFTGLGTFVDSGEYAYIPIMACETRATVEYRFGPGAKSFHFDVNQHIWNQIPPVSAPGLEQFTNIYLQRMGYNETLGTEPTNFTNMRLGILNGNYDLLNKLITETENDGLPTKYVFELKLLRFMSQCKNGNDVNLAISSGKELYAEYQNSEFAHEIKRASCLLVQPSLEMEIFPTNRRYILLNKVIDWQCLKTRREQGSEDTPGIADMDTEDELAGYAQHSVYITSVLNSLNSEAK